MTAKWSLIFRARLALELLSITYRLAIVKKSMDIAPAMKPGVFPFPLGPFPPKKTLNLKKESFVFVCVGNPQGNRSLLQHLYGRPVLIHEWQASCLLDSVFPKAVNLRHNRLHF